MIARELEHQARAEPPQGIRAAVQQANLPAFDIGLDEIKAIEPERGDDGVECGQRDELLRHCGPAVFRLPEMRQPEAEAAATLYREGQRTEPGNRTESQGQDRDIAEATQPYDGAQDRA